MKDERATYYGMGPNVDGQWVNHNHTCSCGERLPLPKWQDKFCPKCGTQQPGPKMKAKVEEEKAAKQKTCLKCGHTNKEDANFCTECGTKLPVLRDSIVKEM